MRIPIFWLKYYIKVPADLKTLTHDLTMVGHMLDKTEKYKGQTVIDLELRGNRADCYSILGIAREVSALYKQTIKQPETLPKLKKLKQLRQINLKIESKYARRVMMSIVNNIKIINSPDWLKDALEASGVDSINNIVDLTNYVCIETGQPMHAFDLDKLGKNIQIRLAKKGEKMITFQDKELVLDNDDLVWSKSKEVLSVAGAIGGKYHSVAADTNNILIEAASYDRANIRRSVHRHNLFTEAGIRHEKDLDPTLVEFAISRFLYLVNKHKWGSVVNTVVDYYPEPVVPWEIKLKLSNLKNIAGYAINKKVVLKILKDLGFEIINQISGEITVKTPTLRTDVVEEADLIEEILRINGYDNIPVETLSLAIPDELTPDFIKQEEQVRNQLTKLSFNEIISLSFVKEKLTKLNKSLNLQTEVVLQNPPSPDYKTMRTTLLPNLYEAAKKAIDEREGEINYFEVGKVYSKQGEIYKEHRTLGMISYKNGESIFRQFKGKLDELCSRYKNIKFLTSQNQSALEYLYVIKHGNIDIGFGGEIRGMQYAEIDLELILGQEKTQLAKLWPKYPPQIEDITFEIPEKTNIGDIIKNIKSIKNVEMAELVTKYNNAYTFRVWYQSKQKTFTDKEVEVVRNKILKKVESKFGGVVKS